MDEDIFDVQQVFPPLLGFSLFEVPSGATLKALAGQIPSAGQIRSAGPMFDTPDLGKEHFSVIDVDSLVSMKFM